MKDVLKYLRPMENEDDKPEIVLTPEQGLQIAHEIILLRQFRDMVHKETLKVYAALGFSVEQ